MVVKVAGTAQVRTVHMDNTLHVQAGPQLTSITGVILDLRESPELLSCI